VATPEAIAAFRLLINAPLDEDPYTDDQLSDRLDAATSTEALAGIIWREKAASYSTLVNVSESGSARSLGDLYKNAIAMAKFFDDSQPGDSGAQVGVRMRRLTRS
jgi:hypothetical protein